MFGEFLSSRDVDRPGQSASCSPCIGESRAFEVTRFPGLCEAHEFSCPGGIPLPSSVVVSGRSVAPAGSSLLFLGSHDIPRSSFRRWCLMFILSYRAIRRTSPADNDRRHETRGLGLPPNRPRAPHCALLTKYRSCRLHHLRFVSPS